MSIKRSIVISLIREELRDNKEVTNKAIRLYIENKISYKTFLQIKNEEL